MRRVLVLAAVVGLVQGPRSISVVGVPCAKEVPLSPHQACPVALFLAGTSLARLCPFLTTLRAPSLL